MIGIVIPAHNEADYLAATLEAALLAAAHPGLAGEEVRIAVVLDACTDASAAIVADYGVYAIETQARNVGVARCAGVDWMIAAGARWLAFTDADTIVSPDWLVQQLALQADAVCGSIGIADWSVHGAHAEYLRRDFEATYVDRDGHRHIHGANMGVSVQAYLAAGGLQPLACSEDVALVHALERSGARIVWSAAPRVRTSARVDARARGGFGDAVLAVLARVCEPAVPHAL